MSNRIRLEIGSVLLIVAVYFVLAGLFAAEQSIWVDETTQLAGLTLGFEEQWNWLVGRSDVVLGVPPDRMPPFSYWIGNVWGSVFGVSEASMRWLGIAAVGCAAPALYMVGRLISGTFGGFLCLAVVLLSGTAITTATAIRAYPIYLALMCWATLFYGLLIVRGDSLSRYVGLALCLVVASYTHFFGVIAAVCMGAALLLDRIRRQLAVWPVIAFATVGTASLVGLMPFVLAAIEVSSNGPSDHPGLMATIGDAARLVFRVVAHPNLMGMAGLMETHLAAVLIMGISAGVLCLNKKIDPVFVSLLVPIGIGFSVLLIAGLVVSGFDVFAPHYNLWMIPLATSALAYALAPGADLGAVPVRRWVSRLAGVLMIATTMGGSISMARHAMLYSNGPGDWMASRLDNWSNTLVIHASDGPWGSLYFALFHHSGGALTQWLLHEDGSMADIDPMGFNHVLDPTSTAAAYDVVLLARSFSLDSMEIARLVRGKDSCTDVVGAVAGPDNEAYCAYLGVGVRQLSDGL